jgi:hypothetical protein
VAVLRVAEGRADHLLLGDSVLVLDGVDSPTQLVEDRREPHIARPLRQRLAALDPDSGDFDRLRSALIAAFRERRNQPGGFWVAQASGHAAAHALTGGRPAAELKAVALLSNGASRVVDRFGLMEWSQVPAVEPEELIRLVRDAELAQGVEADDATAACWRF